MTDKHTQGEWSINSWPQAGSDISIGAPGTPCIARVPLRDVSINEQRANAMLITAANDMLGALRELMEWQVKNVPNWNNPAYDNAARVVAKATGQTP